MFIVFAKVPGAIFIQGGTFILDSRVAKMILQKMSTMMYCDIASVHDGKRKVSNMNFVTSNLHIFVHSTY